MERLHYPPPTEQVYESFVPEKYRGVPIEHYFVSRFDYLSKSEWIGKIRAGMITVNGETVSPGYVLKSRDRLVTRMGYRREPPANRELEIIFQDQHIRVFNKAAPIPVHPSGRYFNNSMTELLKSVYPGEVPRPVQRLDATTTGVLMFARTRQAAAFLMNEFKANNIHKEYLAIVEGIPGKKRFLIDAPIGKIRGSTRGTRGDLIKPKKAVTEIQWISSIRGRSLLKVVPKSGRTNQIRVHLTSAGYPVINDAVYGRGGNLSDFQFGLHAYRLGFHYLGNSMKITARCPEHFQPFLGASDQLPK